MTTPTQNTQHEAFTPEMRDRQARGKDPYSKSDGSDDDDEYEDGEGRRRMMRPGHGSKTESFEEREKRAFALSVLDSPEQLTMYAQTTGDSIPGQRQRFAAMLCGFDPPERKADSNSSRRDAKGRQAKKRSDR